MAARGFFWKDEKEVRGMADQKKEDGRKVPLAEEPMRPDITIADYASRKLGIPKRPLPKNWCKVIFKK